MQRGSLAAATPVGVACLGARVGLIGKDAPRHSKHLGSLIDEAAWAQSARGRGNAVMIVKLATAESSSVRRLSACPWSQREHVDIIYILRYALSLLLQD